jgi:hypothetical protein
MKRGKQRKSSIHPIFEEAAAVADNPVWRNRFLSYGKGMLPKGVSLNGNIISYTKMNNPIMYELPRDAESAYLQLQIFFERHLNYPSEKKRPRAREAKSEGWKQIKRIHQKKSLLDRFVESVKERLELTDAQVSDLQYCIYLAELHGALNASIRMKEGLVVEISCIEWDGEKFSLKCKKKPIEPMKLQPPQDPLLKAYPQKRIDLAKISAKHISFMQNRANGSIVRELIDDDPSRASMG